MQWREAGERLGRTFADPNGRWSRIDTLLTTALMVLVLATRWTFRARILTYWDSIWFALALNRYDVAASQPQPPGYPVFVALARIVQFFRGDANSAIVTLAILFSMAATALLYAFVRSWGSARAATLAAVPFAFTPAFWFNGVVAISYAAEAVASIAVAYLAWVARKGNGRAFWALGAALGLASGLRPSVGLFLGPVVLWSVIAPGGRPLEVARRLTAAGSACLVAVLAWFLPMLSANPGGWSSWWLATRLQSRNVVFADTAWTGGTATIVDHARRLRLFLHAEEASLLPVLFAVVFAAWLLVPRRKPRDLLREARFPSGAGRFLLAWLLPGLLFYVFVFDGLGSGPTGYVLTVLPGLYVVLGIVGDTASSRLQRHARPPVRALGPIALAALMIVPSVGYAQEFRPLWDKEVRDHEAWAESWSHLAEAFPPNETGILTWYNWAHTKYYMESYTVWTYLPIAGAHGDWVLTLESRNRRDDLPVYASRARDAPGPAHPIPDTVRRIVVFDFQLAGENGGTRRIADDVEIREARLPNDWRVLYFDVDAGRPTIEEYFKPLPNAAHLTDDFRI